MKFSERLKRTRIEQSISQKEMASFLNMSESGYAHWEQGRTEPSMEYLKKICELLHVSSDYLIGLEAEDGTRITEEFTYTDGTHNIQHKIKK